MVEDLYFDIKPAYSFCDVVLLPGCSLGSETSRSGGRRERGGRDEQHEAEGLQDHFNDHGVYDCHVPPTGSYPSQLPFYRISGVFWGMVHLLLYHCCQWVCSAPPLPPQVWETALCQGNLRLRTHWALTSVKCLILIYNLSNWIWTKSWVTKIPTFPKFVNFDDFFMLTSNQFSSLI